METNAQEHQRVNEKYEDWKWIEMKSQQDMIKRQKTTKLSGNEPYHTKELWRKGNKQTYNNHKQGEMKKRGTKTPKRHTDKDKETEKLQRTQKQRHIRQFKQHNETF